MEREEDLTERKRAEEALRESEELFRQCFDNANIGMCLVDLEMHLMRVNPQMAAMFGYTQGEMEGRGVNDFTHPEDLGVSPDFIHRAASGEKQKAQFTKRYLHKQGHVLWGQVSSSLVRDAAGKPLYFISHVQDITELKQAEEARERTEKRFRKLVEQSLQGLLIAQGIPPRLVFVNLALADIVGYTVEELLVMPPKETEGLIHPEDRALFFSRYRQRLKGEPVPSRYEVRALRKDGSVRWVEVLANLTDFSGQDATQLVIMDITERRRAEEALQESEEKYRLLVENSQQGILVLQDGKIQFANPRVIQHSGYSLPELAARPFLELVHPEDRGMVGERYTKRLKGEKSPDVYQFRFLDKQGQVQWVEANSVLIPWKGKPAALSFLSDINERKRAEEHLAYQASLLANVHDAVIAFNEDFKVTSWNRAAEEMYGWKAEEVIGRTRVEVLKTEYAGTHREEAIRTLKETGQFQGELIQHTRDGQKIYVETKAVVLKDPAGRVTGYVSVNRDITVRKQAEVALQESEERYRTLVNNLQEGVYLFDLDGRFTFVNPVMVQRSGISAEKFKTLHYSDITGPEYSEPARLNFERSLRGEYGPPFEFSYRTAHGTKGFIEANTAPLFKDGKVAGILGVSHDTTERKRVEIALQESEAHYRLLAENVTDVIWTLDLDLRFTYFSPSILRQRGYSVEEAKSLSLKETLTPASFEKAMLTFSEEMALEGSGQGDPHRSRILELENLCKDGSTIWTEVTTTFLRDPTGRPMGVLGVTRDISGRRKAEEALRESEAMSRAVLDHSPVGISIRDQAGALLQVNEAWKKIWAISDAEIQENEKWSAGRSWKERCPYLGDSARDLDRLFTPEGGVSILYLPELEIPEPRPGAANWISMYLYALRNQEGRVEKVVTLTQDITGRKRSEEGLKKSEAKYRELVENANSIILRRDPKGRITFFNEFAQRFFGFREEEILGRNIVGTIVPEKESSGRDLAEMIRDISRHPERYATNENENVLRNGERVWIAWTNKPILDPDGKLAEILCIGNDITVRKRAEELLAESEVKYRILVEGMSEAVMQVDNDDRVQFVNSRFCQMIGYGENELLGRVGYEIYFDPEEQELIRRKNRLRLEKASDAYETRMRKKTGEEVLVRISGSPVTDAQGNVVGSIGVITDITAHKLLEAEFLQAQKMEALGRLAGGVAHDFNNLLTSIMGYSDLLAKKLAEDDPSGPQRRWADNILSSANRAANLTQQLLSLSRRQAVQLQVLDLNRVVAEVERILRGLTGEAIELTIHTERALGRVKADPVQIEQVLMNLAINARDAMPRGGQLSITTANVVLDKSYAQRWSNFTPGPYVMIAVSDTGHGMDAEVQSHLFEPFFTTKDKGKGTGLGLSTAYSIVKQTGGHIVVESAPGKGSAFKIYLPRTEEPPAPLASSQPRPPGPVEAELPRGVETVLLAEDEEIVRSLAREVLRDAGYTVLEAGDGEEALKVAASHPGPIHLLLTDVIMPRIGGPALARRLQPLRPDMRVLFMSGYTDGDISSYGGLGSETSLLQKPFQPMALARRVREILESP